MPATKKAAADDDTPKAAKQPTTDAQGHRLDGPDAVPSAEQYDPAVHANHSHPNP